MRTGSTNWSRKPMSQGRRSTSRTAFPTPNQGLSTRTFRELNHWNSAFGTLTPGRRSRLTGGLGPPQRHRYGSRTVRLQTRVTRKLAPVMAAISWAVVPRRRQR